ncbi:MAG: FecR domain-containing protein [Sphingobium sp.]
MTFPDTEEGRASREAIDWLILLQDDPDDREQRQAFESWLAASPLHVDAWKRHGRTYELLSSAPAELREQWHNAPQGARAWTWARPILSRTGTSRHRSRRAWTAAGFAAAACLMLALMPSALLHLRADAITGTAEIRNITLPDGSTAMLAPDSALQIAYRDGERQVRLLGGEAWFDVRRDPARPFRVISGETRTTVIGTAFDVRLRDDGVRVAVERGHVRVERTAGTGMVAEDLLPGQWTMITGSGRVERGKQSAAAAAGWKAAYVMIKDRPITEAVDELRPWFSGTIILADRALGRRRITGSYDARDPVAAIGAMASIYGGQVTRITPWVIVIS